VLYGQLKTLLEANDNDPKKAFANSVYKNNKTHDKNGRPLMPVSTIKVYTTDPDRSGFYINDGKGFVNNGSMVRLDVYSKKNAKGKIEHFFVPIYTHQVKTGSTKILPTPKGFTDVDESFDKICSLYSNDYAMFTFEDNSKNIEGYYVKYGINNGALQVIGHSSANKEKDSLVQVSPRSATKIERLDISVLGDNYWE
jgi:CRISPR/Cas system Type II protein with McrA/HNH and RuvC-like nuclease domain